MGYHEANSGCAGVAEGALDFRNLPS
jgi:hypothetical protein